MVVRRTVVYGSCWARREADARAEDVIRLRKMGNGRLHNVRYIIAPRDFYMDLRSPISLLSSLLTRLPVGGHARLTSSRPGCCAH